jgi:hypothetical protein
VLFAQAAQVFNGLFQRKIYYGTRFVGEETPTISQRIRNERQGPDGFLYLRRNEDSGALLHILPRNISLSHASVFLYY